MRRIWVITAGAAVVVAAGGVVLGVQGERTPAAAAAQARTAPDRPAAISVAAMRKALVDTAGEITTVTTTVTKDGVVVLDDVQSTGPNGTFVSTSLGTGGTPVFSQSVTAGAATNIDYRSRTWWTTPSPAMAPRFNPGQVAGDLAAGALHVVGPRTRDGRPVVELTGHPASLFGLPLTVDIDPATQLPVWSSSDQPSGVNTTTYAWSPAGSTAPAALEPVPPAGFQHLAAPPKAATGVG